MRLAYTAFAATVVASYLGETTNAQGGLRPCNEIITIATANEIRRVAEVFAQSFEVAGATTDPDDIASAAEIFAAPINFDVAVSKICSSCEEAFSGNGAVPTSCETGTFGRDAIYSALAFHPLDEDGQVINGELNGQMSLLSTRFNLDMVPTISFPDSITQALTANDFTYAGNGNTLPVSFIDVYQSLLTASAGGIGMIFDGLGTGESEDGFDRSWGIKHPVQQGAVVTWKAVQDYTSQVTNGCTTLLDRTFLYGYSLGAHHAMWASVALQELGVEIVQAFIQAGPYDLEGLSAFQYVQQALQGLTLDPLAALYASAMAVGYSNPDAVYLPNAAAGQFYISDEWRNASDISRNVPEWWFGDELEAQDVIGFLEPPEALLGMYSPAIAEINIESITNGGRPCDDQFVTEEVQFLCQALRENADVYPLIFETTFPIQTCHSPNDEVVPFFTTDILPETELITRYVAPFPFMEPISTHVDSHVACWGSVTVWMVENAAYFSEIVEIEEGIDGRNCSATIMPTVSPSIPPSMGPTEAPVEGSSATPTMAPTIGTGAGDSQPSSALGGTEAPSQSAAGAGAGAPSIFDSLTESPTSGGVVPTTKSSFGAVVVVVAMSWLMTVLVL